MRTGVRLGVDVGSVRIGVACSDPDGILATPVATVPAGDGAPDPVAAVAALASGDDPAGRPPAAEIVVGLPRSLSGQEGPAAQTARAFAVRLAAAVRPVPVRLVDERLTTVDAQRHLRASGRSERTSRDVVDQAAAVVILQHALDAERASGRAPGEAVTGRKPRHRGAR
ncbi:Holliday junction resolvase RuvX [Agilicoccus flavus]|uniref:Holliday junction resolvase RuvX n=1 Tax=Agilicoccus flavus TaxID=2775968 RepID=UPI001CF61068|nr:Holliday junction resolvase RuvX [Agilicoccus flavus]